MSELVAAVAAFRREQRAIRGRANFKVIDGGAAPTDEAAAFFRVGTWLAQSPTQEGTAWVARLLRPRHDPDEVPPAA